MKKTKKNIKTKDKTNTVDNKKLNEIKRLCKEFSTSELKSILKSGKIYVPDTKISYPEINFSGKKVCFGAISDTHMGSIYYHKNWFREAFRIFNRENCKFITHSGDITDGLSNRPGHVYKLTHIGYDQQKKFAINQFKTHNKNKIPIYCVDGNHDRWFIKSSGAIIVKDIANEVDELHFLGHDIADIKLKNLIIKLWHGEDGSSYATSYRPQKIVESLTGGEKPDILIAGHVHKQGYFFERHIHVVSAGAMCSQSSYMKSKRLANHAGFSVIEATTSNRGVASFKIQWFPFYG